MNPPNRSVRNAFELLELLAGSPDGLTLARLVQVSGLPKTTTHRLLSTLAELDIVCHEGSRYHVNAHRQHDTGAQFTAPILTRDGHHLAGLTLRTRTPVTSPAAADRLTRLVTDLATAVSRQLHPS